MRAFIVSYALANAACLPQVTVVNDAVEMECAAHWRIDDGKEHSTSPGTSTVLAVLPGQHTLTLGAQHGPAAEQCPATPLTCRFEVASGSDVVVRFSEELPANWAIRLHCP